MRRRAGRGMRVSTIAAVGGAWGDQQNLNSARVDVRGPSQTLRRRQSYGRPAANVWLADTTVTALAGQSGNGCRWHRFGSRRGYQPGRLATPARHPYHPFPPRLPEVPMRLSVAVVGLLLAGPLGSAGDDAAPAADHAQPHCRRSSAAGPRARPTPRPVPRPLPRRPLFDPARHMRVAEVRPGMKGYGLSVFRGTKIERFDVEVISILQQLQPQVRRRPDQVPGSQPGTHRGRRRDERVADLPEGRVRAASG